MRICVVGLRGVPNVMGGIETHCEQLYQRIAKTNKDFEISLLARRPYVDVDAYVYRGIKVVPIWALKNKYLETVLHTFLAVLYAKFVSGAEMIHIHGIGPGLFAPLARALRMRVVVTHHGSDYNRKKWGKLAKFVLKLGEAFSIGASHKVLVVGKSLAGDLKSRHPESADKILYVPNGAEIPAHGAAIDCDTLLDGWGLKSGNYILAVGRLVPEKGFHDLVNAYKGLSHKPFKLVIAGAADHQDKFCTDLLKHKSKDILFVGFQKGESLRCLYSHSALFVLPSYHEGLPIVVLEALSYNLPVVLSNIEPNTDIGLADECYFDTGNINSLKERISGDSFECFRIADRGFLKSYDWDHIANQTAAVYMEA